MKYIYPKLPGKYTLPYLRIGGNGLANCLFVYAKAIVMAYKYNAKIISPAWINFSLGTYLRRQSDKRHYIGLMTNKGEIKGLKKLFVLSKEKAVYNEKDFNCTNGILIVEGIYDFFKPLLEYHQVVKDYIFDHINPNILNEVEHFDFDNCIAVHIRLGDFSAERRVPMEWYINQIEKFGKNKRILLFSDGTDEELSKILTIQGVERAYFGGAIQDIVAISKCSFVIGSDSSFSAWGIFLGQVPCVFYRIQFGTLLQHPELQMIELMK